MFADWIGFDFDSGEMTLGDALNSFCDMIHVIGVTMSHQTEPEWTDKFRVLFPLERRIENLALYRHQLKIGLKKWPADEKCKDGARLFYPCREIVSVCTEGYSWEIDEDVEPEPDYAALTVARVKSAIIPPWVTIKLRSQWEPHTYNDTCFKLGCALGPHGYSPDEIVAMILNGPTYKGRAAPKKEIFDSVVNGIERGLKDFLKSK